MIYLTKAEADLYEATKTGLSFKECEIKYDMKARSLTTAFQNLVLLGIVERVNVKTYCAKPASYLIKSMQAVRNQRRNLREGIVFKTTQNIDQAAAMYIAGHYHVMTRRHLLEKLKKEGYNIHKVELNEFIIENRLDKNERAGSPLSMKIA